MIRKGDATPANRLRVSRGPCKRIAEGAILYAEWEISEFAGEGEGRHKSKRKKEERKRDLSFVSLDEKSRDGNEQSENLGEISWQSDSYRARLNSHQDSQESHEFIIAHTSESRREGCLFIIDQLSSNSERRFCTCDSR